MNTCILTWGQVSQPIVMRIVVLSLNNKSKRAVCELQIECEVNK